MHKKKQLKEGRTYYSKSLRRYHPQWQEGHGSRNTGLLANDGQVQRLRAVQASAQLAFSVLPCSLVPDPRPWDIVTHFQVRSCPLRPSSWKHSQRNLCLTNALGIVQSKLTIKTKHHDLGILYSISLEPGAPLCEKSELRNRKTWQRNRRRVLVPALSITS